MRGGGLFQRQHPVNARPQFAFRHPAIDGVGRRALLARAGVEHRQSVQRAVFHIKRPDRERRASLPPGHDDHSAPQRQQRNRPVEVWLAQRFPPDIDAFRREVPDGRHHVLGSVVDGQVSAQIPAGRDFFIRARRGNDARAEDFGHLHHAGAHAASATVHKENLPGPQSSVAHQAKLGGDARQ